MQKSIIFLDIATFTNKRQILHHVHQLEQVRLAPGDTYNTLFAKMREHFKQDTDNDILPAVNEWINFQHEQTADHTLFETVIVPLDQPYSQSLFAIFDVRTVSEPVTLAI